jgi:DNA-directed RNA polymerase specialized sigma24 family protein
MRTEVQLDQYAQVQIRCKALSLAKITGSDVEDLKQEMAIYLLKYLPQYRPGRASWKTFIARVLKSFRIDYLRKHHGPKEQLNRSMLSLEEPLAQKRGDTVERHETLIAPKGNNLSPEVAEVIAGLPAELRSVCTALAQGGAAYARKTLELSSRELETHRQSIRQAFLTAGFDQMGF